MVMDFWPELKRLSYVTDKETFAQLLKAVAPTLSPSLTPHTFRDLYRAEVCNKDGWPKEFPLVSEKEVAEGIRIFSMSGKIEGRTTGSRRRCTARDCGGWFVGILWETGQQMHLCSEGWHYSAPGPSAGNMTPRIDIIGGGEISARFVSPRPLGVQPLPRTEWPARSKLRARKGWRIAP